MKQILIRALAWKKNDIVELGEVESFGAEDLPDVKMLANSEFTEDQSEANGTSIAFLAEFEGKRALFSADAHASQLVEALERYSPDQRVSLDLFKISHHGSKYTTSLELIEKVLCPLYLFSTNGSIFKHPNSEAVSRVLIAGGETPTLIFNYRSAQNKIWDLDVLKNKYLYETWYPLEGEEGIEIDL